MIERTVRLVIRWMQVLCNYKSPINERKDDSSEINYVSIDTGYIYLSVTYMCMQNRISDIARMVGSKSHSM